MIKSKLSGDSRGIATIVIVIVVIIVIAGAGVAVYAVVSNNSGNSNNTDDSGGTPALGGPGLAVGDVLVYNISAGATGTVGGDHISETNAMAGTITISCAHGSGDNYTITVALNVNYDVSGVGHYQNMSQSVTATVSSLDMMEYGTNTTDLSNLSDYGYTSDDLNNIMALVERFTKETVNLPTVDGNVNVEKRTYAYDWNDIKTLIPDVGGIDQIPVTNLDASLLIWFGKDILYKATFDIKIWMDIMGNGGSDYIDVFGSIELASHTAPA